MQIMGTWPIAARKRVQPLRFGTGAGSPAAGTQANGVWQTIQPDLFAPQRPVAGRKRFAVLGDAGNGEPGQMEIARRMLSTYGQNPFASVLVLGDNVYEHGEPWLFKERIQEPYKDLMAAGIRFFPVMGNHDVRQGYGTQQLDFWGTPAFYTQRLGDDTEIFALDTTVMLPGYDNCYQDNPFLARKKAEVQLAWLDKALKDSDAKFKIVMGHYPLYSSGLHGTRSDSTLRLRKILEPILVRNGVDVYLAGHEHHYEKSQPIQGIRHFVSGAGGKLRADVHYKSNPPYPRAKLVAKRHFMLFEETPQGLKYEVVSGQGQTLDAGLIPPRQVTQVRFA